MNLRDSLESREEFGQPSLDDLFRRAAERAPEASALVDPPDREDFIDAAPRRLTYADAECAVEAMAERLLDLGLPAGSIIGFQVPNVVESVITLLGVLRAGLIAAPMPLLWRQADAVAALGRLAPRALVAVRRVGAVDHGEIITHVAAEIFPVRFVCGFGSPLPDGVIPLDDVFEIGAKGSARSPAKTIPPQDVAVVTFDLTARGIIPVAHTHGELLAAGNAIVAEAALTEGGAILGALATSSFAGLGSVVMPWLITGGRLALHQPFSPDAFAAQLNEHGEIAVVPGAILGPLQAAGLLDGASALRGVMAVWRSPEFLSAAPVWPNSAPACIDVAAFGEVGILCQRRGVDGIPAAIRLGAPDAATAIEVARTATGTLAVRGRMVPACPLAGAGLGDPPPLKRDAEGFVDTEYPCRLDRGNNALIVSGPPAGLINVGGYQFAWRELQDLIAELGEGGSLAALPDRLVGHRLAGVAADRDRVRSALAARGSNPLIINAFRDRS